MTATEKPVVELFTDGSCLGNPGPGGWAYILRHPATRKSKEASGGEANTTNNRMELMSVLQALEALHVPTVVNLCSDSKYLLDGLRSWLPKWKLNGWRTSAKQPVKNDDLWRRLDKQIAIHELRFNWTKGHAGHAENERCDLLAQTAARKVQSR
jgi:ribonuclease HI